MWDSMKAPLLSSTLGGLSRRPRNIIWLMKNVHAMAFRSLARYG